MNPCILPAVTPPHALRKVLRNLRPTLPVAAVVAVTVVSALSAPTAAAAPVAGPWVSIAGVYGSGEVSNFTAADQPQPGVSIMQTGDFAITTCTASWAVVSARLDVGYLTAGHCDKNQGAPIWMYANNAGTKKLSLSPLQNAERGVDGTGHGHDSALFFLPPTQQATGYGTDVAEGVKLRGVMSVSQARQLPAGTPVCMNGSRSGLTCGPLIAARDTDLEWGGGAVEGDSGAPVFVVDRRGDAMAIGMLQRGPTQTDNFATYLAPVLSRLQLRAVVEEGAR